MNTVNGIKTFIVTEMSDNSVQLTFKCIDKEARGILYKMLNDACKDKNVVISFKLD